MRLKIACRKAYEFKSHLQHFVKEKPKVLVIVGPTASGKTSLSVTLAERFNGEIISADSRQVYRGLDLGTGKITHEEMHDIPHHLLDVQDPKDTYTVTDFVRDGRKVIESILSRNKLPIIVGGTFFYIDALLGRISTPEVPPNEALRKRLETVPTETLVKSLERLDPDRAETIDRDNRRRLIRALEIVEALGTVPETQSEEIYTPLTLGMNTEKDVLEKNIHDRLTIRFDAGMVEEVKNLHAQGLSYERMDDLGLEYRYIAQYLQNIITYEEMLATLEIKTRQYAKRQMTWLKRGKDTIWVHPTEIQSIEKTVTEFLK